MLSNDLTITLTSRSNKNKAVSKAKINKAVIIKGGANVTDPKTLNRNVKFVTTEIATGEYTAIKEHPVLLRMVDRGFVTIGKEPEALKTDKSAQLTEKQVKAKSKAKVSTGQVEE